MKPLNFILTGVGGQGILLSSDILCLVGMTAGYDVKKTDVHGMAQRGPAASSATCAWPIGCSPRWYP